MARRRVSGGNFRSVQRPNRAWSGAFAIVYTTVAPATKVLIGGLATGVTGGVDLTILRTVGGISVRSDQAAALEPQLGSFGMILVTDIAFAAGIASIPGPATDAGDDWFVHQSFQQSGQQDGTSRDGTYYAIDSKAKRVLDGTGMVIAIVAENVSAAQGLQIVDGFRLLTQVRGTR